MRIPAGRRRTAVPLLLLAAALGLYLASLVHLHGGEPPPDLVSLAARAASLVEAADRALTAAALGGGAEPPEPSEVATVASGLRALNESLQPGGDLSSRLIAALDTYCAVLDSVYTLSSGFTRVSEGVGRVAEALDLLAECRVEDALSHYAGARDAAEEALELLVTASLRAAPADPEATIAEEHRGVIKAYRDDLLALTAALDKAVSLLEAVEDDPGLGKALCRADSSAVHALAARLGTTPARLASTLYTLSPSLAGKIAEAAAPPSPGATSTGGSSPGGAGAGAAGAGSDD